MDTLLPVKSWKTLDEAATRGWTNGVQSTQLREPRWPGKATMAAVGEGVNSVSQELVKKLQEELKRERKAGRVKEHELVELQRTMNENARRNASVITSLQNSELRLSDKVGRYAHRVSSLAKHVRSLQSKLAQKNVDVSAIPSDVHEEPLDTTEPPIGSAEVEDDRLLGEAPPDWEERVIALASECEALKRRNVELEREGESYSRSKTEFEAKLKKLQTQLLQGSNRRSSIVTQLQSNEAMLMSSLDDLKDERKELRSRLEESVAELSRERERNRSLELALEEERTSNALLAKQTEGAQGVISKLQGEVVEERAAKNAALEQHKRESAQLAAVRGELTAERDAHKHSRQQLAQERAAHAETLKQKEGASASEQSLALEKTVHAQTRHELDEALQQLLRTQAVLEDERRLRSNAENTVATLTAELEGKRQGEPANKSDEAASADEGEEREGATAVKLESGDAVDGEAGEKSVPLHQHEAAMQTMEEQVVRLKGRVRSLEEENAAQVERLRADNESMEKVLNDSVSVEETAASRLAQLEVMLEASHEQMDDLKTALNSVRVKEQEATEALEQLRLEARGEKNAKDKSMAEMEAEIEALSAQLEQQSHSDAPVVENSLPVQIDETERQRLVQEHHEQMESLHREFTKQRQQLGEANETLTEKVKEYHSTVVALQQKLRAQQEEHGKISSSLQSNNARLSEQLAEYRKRMNAAAETASRLKAIQQQVPPLQRALSSQQEKYRAYELAVKLRDTKLQEQIHEQSLTIRDLRVTVKEMEKSSVAHESGRAALAQDLADAKSALKESQRLADELSTCRQELVASAEKHAGHVQTIASLAAQVEESGQELARALQAAAEHEREALASLQEQHQTDMDVVKAQLEKTEAEFATETARLKEQVELTHAERKATLAAAEKQQKELLALREAHTRQEEEVTTLRKQSLTESSTFTDMQLSLARHVQLLDATKMEKVHLQSQVEEVTAQVKALEAEQTALREKQLEEQTALRQRAAQEKVSYDEGLARLYERHQAELRAAQQLMQQRDQLIARLKVEVEANLTAKQQCEEELQKRSGEAQRAMDVVTRERAMFETKLRASGAALAVAKSVGDEKERSLIERLKKAQLFMEESERSLKTKEAEARKSLEESNARLQRRIEELEKQNAADTAARKQLETACSVLKEKLASVTVAAVPSASAVQPIAEEEPAPTPAAPVPMVISDKEEESLAEQLERQRAEVETKLELLEAEKKKIKQERRQQQSEIQELNLLMGETERRHHGLLTRLQNREYELVMENQHLAAELEAARKQGSQQRTAAPSSPVDGLADLKSRYEELALQSEALVRENQSLQEELRKRTVIESQGSADTLPEGATNAATQLQVRCDELLAENGELVKLVSRLQEEMAALAVFQNNARREQEDQRQSAGAREEEVRRRLGEAEALIQQQEQQLQRLSEESRGAQRTEATLNEQLEAATASLAHTQSQLSLTKSVAEGEVRKLAPAQETARVLAAKLEELQMEKEVLTTQLQEALSSSQASNRNLVEVIAAHAAEMATVQQEALDLKEAEEESRHRLLQVEKRADEAARSAAGSLSQCENQIRVLKGEKSSLEAGLATAVSQLSERNMESAALVREKEGLVAAVANKDMLLVKEQSSATEAMILLAEMQEELDALKTSAAEVREPISPSPRGPLAREIALSPMLSPVRAQAPQSEFSPARGAALVDSNRLLQEELSRARDHISSMAEAVRSAEARFQEQMEREREGSRAGVARLQSQLEGAVQSLQMEKQRVEQLQQQLSHAQSAAEQLQRRSQSLLQSAESGASAHSRQAQEERRLRLQQQSRAEQLERELEEERIRVTTLEQAQTATMSQAHRSVGQALQKEQHTAKLLQEHNQALQQRLRGENERVQQIQHTVEAVEAEKLSLKESRRRLEEWAQQAQEQNEEVLQQLHVTEGQRDEYADALVEAMLELELEQKQLLVLKQSQQALTEQLRTLTHQLNAKEQRSLAMASDEPIDSSLAAELEKSQVTASLLQEMVANLEEQVGALQQMLSERQQRASDSNVSAEQELRQLQSSHSHTLQELRAERVLVQQHEEQARQLSLALDQRSKQCQELSGRLQRAQALLQKQQLQSTPVKREGSELEMAKLHIQGLESQLLSAADQYRALEHDMQRLSSTLQGVPAEEHRRAQEMASKLEAAHREMQDLATAADSARDAAARAIEARRQLEALTSTLEQSLEAEKNAHLETTSLMESALISLALADEEQQIQPQQERVMVPEEAMPQPRENLEKTQKQMEEEEYMAMARTGAQASTEEETRILKERAQREEGERWHLQQEVLQLRMRLDEYRELVTTQEGELSSLKGMLRSWKASDAVASQSPVRESMRESVSESLDRGLLSFEGETVAHGANASSMWQRISLLESQLDRARAAEATAQQRVREMLLSREHDLDRRETGSEETAHLRAEVRMLRQLLQESRASAQKSRAGEESALSSISLLQRTHDRDLDLLADAKVSLERERREHSQSKGLLEEAQQAAEEYAARTDRLRKELDSQRQAMATDATSHSSLVRGLQSKLETALAAKQELSSKERQISTALVQIQQQLASKEATLTAFQNAVQEESRSHQRIILDLEAAVRQLQKEKSEGLQRLEEFELISGQLNELSSQYQGHLETLQKSQEELELRYAQEVEKRTLSEQQLATLQESAREQQRRFGRMQEQLMILKEGGGPSNGVQSILQALKSQVKEERERLQKTVGELEIQKSLRAKAEVQLQLAKKTVETLQRTMARDSKAHQELVFSLQQNFTASSRAREEQGELVAAAKDSLKAERNKTTQVARELSLARERCERLVAELGSTSAALVDTQVRNEGLAAKLSDLKGMLTERERTLEESYATALAAGQCQREKLTSELTVSKRESEELLKTLHSLAKALVEFEGELRPVGEIEGQRSRVEESIAAEVKTVAPPGKARERILQLVRLLKQRFTLAREETEKLRQEKERTVRERECEIEKLKESLTSQALELSALSRSSFAERERKLKEEKSLLEERISTLEESLQGDKALARKVEGAVIGEMDALRCENATLSTEKKAMEEEKAQLEGLVQELEEETEAKEGQLEGLRKQLLHQQQLLKLARLTLLKEDEELERRVEQEQEEIRQQKIELTELFRLSQRLIRLKEESEARLQVACQEYDQLHDLWQEEHEELLLLRQEVGSLQEEAALSDALDERISQLEEELEQKEVQLQLLRCVHEEEQRQLVAQLRHDARLLRPEGL